MVGLFSVASALPSCFPKKLDIWSPRAGAGVPLTSLSFPSLEPWHPALGKKLDRKYHSICNITAFSQRRWRWLVTLEEECDHNTKGRWLHGCWEDQPGELWGWTLCMQWLFPALSNLLALLSCLAWETAHSRGAPPGGWQRAESSWSFFNKNSLLQVDG